MLLLHVSVKVLLYCIMCLSFACSNGSVFVFVKMFFVTVQRFDKQNDSGPSQLAVHAALVFPRETLSLLRKVMAVWKAQVKHC